MNIINSINSFRSIQNCIYCSSSFSQSADARNCDINYIANQTYPCTNIVWIVDNVNDTVHQRCYIKNDIPKATTRIASADGIVATIGKHIVSQQSLSSSSKYI